MKMLLLSTAILGAAAMPALAQDMEVFRGAADPMEIRTSDLMGMRIYASEAAVDADEYEGLQEGWEDIGEVNDVILGRDGTVQAVLVDIGGFLGIGERQVAVSMDALRFVGDSATAEADGDYFLVMNAARADLEAAPDYMAGEMGAEEAAMETEEAVGDATTTTTTVVAGTAAAAGAAAATAADAVTDEAAEVGEDVAAADTAAAATEAATETEMEAEETAEAATEGMATDEVATTDTATTDMAADTEVAADGTTTTVVTDGTTETTTDGAMAEGGTATTREGYLAAPAESLTADTLQGAAVYDANDERVGEVSELLMDEGGQITDVVVDVGGFLGIGEKPVAMQMGSLEILQQEGGGDLRVYVSDTREQLEAMPTYEN